MLNCFTVHNLTAQCQNIVCVIHGLKNWFFSWSLSFPSSDHHSHWFFFFFYLLILCWVFVEYIMFRSSMSEENLVNILCWVIGDICPREFEVKSEICWLPYQHYFIIKFGEIGGRGVLKRPKFDWKWVWHGAEGLAWKLFPSFSGVSNISFVQVLQIRYTLPWSKFLGRPGI